MTWYISRDGVKDGPYSDERLGELIETGHLKPDDLVWRPGLVKWMLAADIPGLLKPPIPPVGQNLVAPSAEPPRHEAHQPIASDQIKLSLIPESPRPSDQPSHKPPRGSYFARHWRGELSLPVSYWVNSFLISAVFLMVIAIVPWDDFVSKSPKLYSVAIIALWVVLAITTLWQLVGTWRSADKYLNEGKSKLWGNFAKVAVVLGLFRAATDFVSAGIPQITEYAKIATGEDPFGTYQLRVLRDATELEIAGVIVFGLTDDVRRTLDAHPTIQVIHLNSRGGRINEARNLRDLIDSRGLTTFTASGCFSACTLAYAAGHKRLIAKDANLGFHQYSFPGVKAHDLQLQYEKDKQDWLARGFARFFIDRAFATPNNEMWMPAHRELFGAGVVTGYPDRDDVAVTGFQVNDSGKLETQFLKNPLFAALKTYEPKTYDQFFSEFRAGLQRGRSEAELRGKLLPIAQSIYMQKLPYASDSALRSFIDLMLEQMSGAMIESGVCA